jgi:hypothetical protein
VNDPVSTGFFPKSVPTGRDAYCIDPHGETRTYGEKAKLTMEDVCTTAFDGECEVYKQFKLTRVVSLRYVDGAGKGGIVAGKGGIVEVNLSQFADPAGAFAMYTTRVPAGADPIGPGAPKALAAGGAAALGTGAAYVWRGAYLVELHYINEEESPDQMAQSSDPVLTALAKAIGGALPGATDPPPSARALPKQNLLANGVTFHTKALMGVTLGAASAVGAYQDGRVRYDVVSIAAASPDEARDLLKTLRARPRAANLADFGDDAIVVPIDEGGTTREFYFARKGAQVFGVGDDPFTTGTDGGAGLNKEDKKTRLRLAFVGAGGGAAVPSAAPSASAPKH